jgi:16S rRNA processing protein RimM
MEVINLDGSILGLVEDVLETGAHDILVVNEGSDEVMIPAVELYVLDIDFDSRKIKVDVPEELININK